MNTAKTVEPAANNEFESSADQALKEKVEADLKAEHNRKLKDVKVLGVNHGVVQMSGTGVTMSGRLRAVEIAWNAAEELEEAEASEIGAAATLPVLKEPKRNTPA